MKAEEQSFKFITNTSRFRIPFFQRGYVWDERNWAPMLEDFLDNKNGQFFGSIILKHLTKGTSDRGSTALVIDGQQRLTTMSILLKAIKDSLNIVDGDVNTAVNQYLFFKPDITCDESFARIEHSKVDKEAFEFVLRSRADDVLTSSSHSGIVQCYKYFFNALQNVDEGGRKGLLNRFVNNEDPFLVVIDLDEKDNEQAIFDTINSAGVRLSYADTIKNLIFQAAIAKAGRGREQEVYSLYETTWFASFEGDEGSRGYWQREAQSIRVKRTMLEVFLHSFAIIHGFYDPRQDSLGQLPSLFNKKMEAAETFDDVKKFITTLAEDAAVYREKLGKFAEAQEFTYGDYVGRLFHILDQCNVLTFHPYLLHLFTKYQNDEAMLKGRFAELERFVMRQYAAHSTTRQNNTYCIEFIMDEGTVRRHADEIQQQEIDSHLRAIGNRQAKLILFWIELYRRHNDRFESEKTKKYCYHLEHILPQKWEEHWSDVPIKGNDGNPITDVEKAKVVRYEKCYEIGNMTLLNGSLNIVISNSSFTKKINGDGRKKGIKDYAELHITKDDILRPFENGDVVWDEECITRRSNRLIDEFHVLWG